VTKKDREAAASKTGGNRRKKNVGSVVERKSDVNFKLSMIKTSLDYEIVKFPGSFKADIRPRNTSRIPPIPESFDGPYKAARNNKRADFLLPPPNRMRKITLSDGFKSPIAARTYKSKSFSSSTSTSVTPGSTTYRKGRRSLTTRESSRIGPIGPGSLKNYISYVTADTANYVPEPVLEPEKGVDFAIYASDDSARSRLPSDQQEVDEDGNKGVSKSYDRGITKISNQFEAIQAQARQAEIEINKHKSKTGKVKLMRASSKDDKELEGLDMEFGGGGNKTNKWRKASNAATDSRKKSKLSETNVLLDGSSSSSSSSSSESDSDDDYLFAGAAASDKDDVSYKTVPAQDGSSMLELFYDPNAMFGGSEKHPSLATAIESVVNRKTERGIMAAASGVVFSASEHIVAVVHSSLMETLSLSLSLSLYSPIHW
jgi:hypothetical protein